MNIIIQDNQAKETSLATSQLVFKAYSKKFKKTILFLLVFGVVCYAYFYYLAEVSPSKNTIDKGIFWKGGLVFSFLIGLILIRLSAAKGRFWTATVSSLDLLYRQTNLKTIIINDEGIEEATADYRHLIKWRLVTSFQVCKDFIRIIEFSSSSIFIPIRLMTNEDYQALLSYLRRSQKEIK
ncbi:hypothetical protein VRU48_13175 [Pedobacter sp. KR3-3]|uniref:YcxB-like protein domain-containing protein n=1 Tax=Pedobacter albus TaxID=3113905 RepID=A0ABU7I9B1_9SPHI|nr:hypothetical protein [Pedobacter sp. KR3-3]MEE1946067.1 hypothetical protein [Pedobacter sp. KR3-3]